jgi:hypothetical protein
VSRSYNSSPPFRLHGGSETIFTANNKINMVAVGSSVEDATQRLPSAEGLTVCSFIKVTALGNWIHLKKISRNKFLSGNYLNFPMMRE